MPAAFSILLPAPPPPEDDAGFTRDELSSQLSEIGSTDSERSEFISKIVSNFDKADANGDGKVSMQEAMAYDQSSQSSSTSSTADNGTASTTSGCSQSDAALMHKIMELARACGPGSDAFSSTSSLTATA